MTEELLAEISILKEKLKNAEDERNEFRNAAQGLWQEIHCKECCDYGGRFGCLAEFEVVKDIGIECVHFDHQIEWGGFDDDTIS